MATYIIRAGLTGPVKIGRADDVEARRADLQTAHHEILHVLRTIDTPFDAEPIMHAQFAHLRIRGEWFEFDPEMLSFVPTESLWTAPEPVGKTWIELLAPWPSSEIARRIGSNSKTVDFWKSGKTPGPNIKFVFAMLNDPDLWKLPLLAAGLNDLVELHELEKGSPSSSPYQMLLRAGEITERRRRDPLAQDRGVVPRQAD